MVIVIETNLLMKAPIIWFSKRQNTVEASTFGSDFQAMKNAVELTEALRYKLRMFGVPIDGPTNTFCDNEAVYKNTSSLPESTLKKEHHAIAYHFCREAVAAVQCELQKKGQKQTSVICSRNCCHNPGVKNCWINSHIRSKCEMFHIHILRGPNESDRILLV